MLRLLFAKTSWVCAFALAFLGAGATAQTFTTLKHFTGNDGEMPLAGLRLAGTVPYGTTWLFDDHLLMPVHPTSDADYEE